MADWENYTLDNKLHLELEQHLRWKFRLLLYTAGYVVVSMLIGIISSRYQVTQSLAGANMFTALIIFLCTIGHAMFNLRPKCSRCKQKMKKARKFSGNDIDVWYFCPKCKLKAYAGYSIGG